MKDKVCIITGATSGIGKVTAIELAKMGARIGIVARNRDKAEKTRDRIASLTGNHHVEIFLADFSSLKEVRIVSAEIEQTYDHIDVLMNNAGILLSKERELSEEGYELTLTINHLSPFLLTASLFDKIKDSKQGRIIHTSSAAHIYAKVDFDNIHLRRNYSAMRAYSNSKLYNLMFNRELAKRIVKYRHLNTLAFHPGVVASSFSQNNYGFMGWFYKIAAPLLTTNEQGAETGIYLATDPKVTKYNGAYFVKKKIATPVKKYLSDALCSRLWAMSEQMTGAKFLEQEASMEELDFLKK